MNDSGAPSAPSPVPAAPTTAPWGAPGAAAHGDQPAELVLTAPREWTPPASQPKRKRRWAWLLVPALLVGVLAFPKSYVLISPGSARGVDSLISVAPDHSYEPSGDFFLLSVSVAQTRFLGEALSGWVDDDVDVHETEEVFGTASPQEYREQNVAAMSDSKQVAMYVALRRLGYEVTENGDGVFVNDIDPTVPAAEVLRQGDVVVEADGTKTLLMGDLVDVIEAHKPGDLLTLRVRRQGAERDVSAKLVEREGRTILGVLIETANQSFNYPFEVSIDSENIGGPSAGLAFTLGLIDRLTDGELAGGAEVAVTGTIQPDGSVGLVGGIRQKALAARRAGATLMLVPKAELAEAKRNAGDLEVRGVQTLDDALEVLADLKGANAQEVLDVTPVTEAA